MLDTGELEWVNSAMKALKQWPELKSVTLTAAWEKPRGMVEFGEELALRLRGETLDGRLYRPLLENTTMSINTGWPRFTHWGKQTWLREMLLDSSRVNALLKEMHTTLGGQLWVDGRLCLELNVVVQKFDINPRNGEIRIILGTS